jgi:MFS family permease
MLSITKKIHKPPGYVVASVLVSLGGVLNGYTTFPLYFPSPCTISSQSVLTSPSYDTGSIGAITEMPTFLSTIGHLTPVMRGFTVSLIMLTGAFPSFFAGQLADRFGRLAIVMAGALTFMVGAILQGSSSRLESFLVGRALCGLGEGLWMSTVTV